jgi:uncharacterized small protein (DUF1192 family)
MSILSPQAARIPIGIAADGAPVLITKSWFDLIAVQLYERAGGAGGPSTTELVESSFEDAGINEMQALQYTFEDGQNQRPTPEIGNDFQIENVAELRERIARLESAVQSLQQGLTS